MEINSHSLFSKWFSEVCLFLSGFVHFKDALLYNHIILPSNCSFCIAEWKTCDKDVSKDPTTHWWQRCACLCSDRWGNYARHIWPFFSLSCVLLEKLREELLFCSWNCFLGGRWKAWQQPGRPARREQNPPMLSGWSTLSSLSWTRSNGQEAKLSSRCSIPFDHRSPFHTLLLLHCSSL